MPLPLRPNQTKNRMTSDSIDLCGYFQAGGRVPFGLKGVVHGYLITMQVSGITGWDTASVVGNPDRVLNRF